MRTCRTCGEKEGPDRVFARGKNLCRPCKNAKAKAYRKANPKEVAAQGKARREANSEKTSARAKAWREANPKIVAARNKAYYQTNPEKFAAKRRALTSNLAPGYVRRCVADRSRLSAPQVTDYLVELARLNILIKRELKELRDDR